MDLPDTSAVGDGYLEVTLHPLTAAKVRQQGVGSWRKPIHGTAVLVAPDGRTVQGHVRTLGQLLPKAQRRYALRITGATFSRIVPLISAKTPIVSDLAPYSTMKAAQDAGSALIQQMIDLEKKPT